MCINLANVSNQYERLIVNFCYKSISPLIDGSICSNEYVLVKAKVNVLL